MQVGSINAPQSASVFDHLIGSIMEREGVSREEAEEMMNGGVKVADMIKQK